MSANKITLVSSHSVPAPGVHHQPVSVPTAESAKKMARKDKEFLFELDSQVKGTVLVLFSHLNGIDVVSKYVFTDQWRFPNPTRIKDAIDKNRLNWQQSWRGGLSEGDSSSLFSHDAEKRKRKGRRAFCGRKLPEASFRLGFFFLLLLLSISLSWSNSCAQGDGRYHTFLNDTKAI